MCRHDGLAARRWSPAPSRARSFQASLASCQGASGDPAARLVGLCLSEDGPALLRPLTPTCSLILELLNGQATPAAAEQPLRRASAFLVGSNRPERLMEIALTVNSNREGMQSFASSLRAALTALCHAKGIRDTAPMMKAALAQCHRDIEGLAELGQEIWELHAYFVFLDVKGDRALLETAAAQLCGALRCTAKDLTLSLVRTGRQVEETLSMLAAQACSEISSSVTRRLCSSGEQRGWSECNARRNCRCSVPVMGSRRNGFG
jgi:hypothetical protein